MGGCVSKNDSKGAKTPKVKAAKPVKGGKPNPLTELTKPELETIKDCTTFSEAQIIELHKNFISECPNGKLSKKDFVKLFKEMHPLDKKKQKAEKFCDYVFNVIDKQKTGFITFKEFVICFCTTSFGKFNDKCEFAFKLYDLDKDGKISKAEMTKVIQALYDLSGIEAKGKNAVTPAKRVEEIFNKLNADIEDKKQKGFLSHDQFIQGCNDDNSLKQLFIDSIFSQ